MEDNTIAAGTNPDERRGSTLKVLAILSWIYMGLALLVNVNQLAQGPLSPEELEQEKARLLESVDPQAIEVLGEEFYEEIIMIQEVSTQYFYLENGLDVVILFIGFAGVMMMYRLKKTGYYLYLLYSVWPLVFIFTYYGAGLMSMVLAIIYGIFSLLFCILYGAQLKRMS